MRTTVPEKAVLVGPEPFRTEFERQAIFGGRKEVYRVGTIHGGWIADYDMAAAYATTAAGWPLPRTPGDFWRYTVWDNIDALSPHGRERSSSATIVHRPTVRARAHRRRGLVARRIVQDGAHDPGAANTSAESPRTSSLGVGQAYKLSYGLADWAGWVIHLLGDNSG